jgi:hypothetical protein
MSPSTAGDASGRNMNFAQMEVEGSVMPVFQ